MVYNLLDDALRESTTHSQYSLKLREARRSGRSGKDGE